MSLTESDVSARTARATGDEGGYTGVVVICAVVLGIVLVLVLLLAFVCRRRLRRSAGGPQSKVGPSL